MATPNRFPSTCKCGEHVAAGAGTVAKVRGKWIVTCERCSGVSAAPKREMLGAIYWPNGMGFTECSLE